VVMGIIDFDLEVDDHYKNKHKDYYLKEIQEDLDWYSYLISVMAD